MRHLNRLFAFCALLLASGLAAGQCAPCTIWTPNATPTIADSGDATGVELGVKFRADSSGYVTGVRFYRSTANGGTHIGNLWSSSGVLLATAQFSGETASGWQQVNFDTPVLISSGTTYIASYFSPQGHYAFDVSFFATSGVDSPPLHALADGVDGANGVYSYGSISSFPNSSYNDSNYWVDVVFVPQGATTAPPAITAFAPANASSGVPIVSSATATFGSPMNASTFNSSTFQLFDSNNNLVSGAVSYSGSGATAIFHPNTSLAYSTIFTAVVRGTVQDFFGNSMGSDVSWTFSTESKPTDTLCPCTIWPSSATPSLADSGDPGSIEVGMKFRADVNGYVTGVRFYKAATNTGTHIGNIWTTSGNLLGSVVFTGESASGWQQATFAVPVPVTAGTMYVASYFDPAGHYSWDEYQLAGNIDNAPLHALSSSSSGGSGVYISTNSSAFPTATYNSSGYGVDVVYVLRNSTTPPAIISVSPGNGSTGVALGGAISAQFSEPMDPATITPAAFQLVDSSNNVIPGTASYTPSTAMMSFHPSLSLTPLTAYTATVHSSVRDTFGNAMASDYTWTFTSAPPPGDSGPGGPILVIAGSTNPFSRYLGEILLNEGLNEFLVKDVTTVTPTVLSQYDIAILGDFPLTNAQASMLNTWVSNGGSLIAMHPDSQLAALLGLTPAGGTLSEGYLRVNTGTAPGTGIYGQTMQFHGAADLYSLSGAASVATLYTDSATLTPTSAPAVTLANAGAGQAAAFTYDLARSVVYTRQGNPAWSGEDRDGYLDPAYNFAEIRSNDMFYGNASFDPQLDWINLNNVQVPQADEQQRLLANLIQLMNTRRKPLPHFWYLPKGYKAVVIMSGDDHGGNGTQPRFDTYIAESPSNCSAADWTCVRATSYIFPDNVTVSNYMDYISQGFEIANHSDNDPTCTTFTAASLDASITASAGRMTNDFPLAPASQTNRTHCVLWSDFDTEPTVLLNHGIRFDTSYYYWPDPWVQGRPGLFTGSGLPMRFADRTGNTIDVYQATTQFPDETTWNLPDDINTVLANATGSLGFYAVLTANMHTDHIQEDGSDQIVAAAQSYGAPVIASLQMLQWLDGRNNSKFSNMSWAGNTLMFTVTAATGAHNLEVMVPAASAAGPLISITLGGTPVSYALQTVKGIRYAALLTTGGDYQAFYGFTYSLSGTISGTGASGATVTLSGAATATTTAGSSGNYSFANLFNGSYMVTPSKSCCTYNPANQSVTVNGTNVSGVNFSTAGVTYSISGTISGPGGNGATVTLSGAATGTATANSSGAYTISGLANGTYAVTPSNPGFTFTPATRNSTIHNANVTALNFATATYTLSGAISGAGGSGATVTLSGAGTGTTTASTMGAYSFSGLSNGAYTVTPSKTGFTFTPPNQGATVTGANVSGVNFSSVAVVTYSISGTISGAGGNGATVTLSGAGAGTTTASSAGAYTFSGLSNGAYTVTPSKTGFTFTQASQGVAVNNANQTSVNFASAAVTYAISGTISGAGGNGATITLSGAAAATTTADTSGNYTFSGLGNGAYTVTPSKAGFTFTPASQGVTVSNANQAGINFSSAAGTYTISGTISGAGGNGATVTLSGAAAATTTADASGNYTFSGLGNGAYTVSPSKAGFTFTPASQGVTVSNANQAGINFSSAAGTYTISGTISGAGGNGATVTLSGAAAATTTADASGNYTFSGLGNGAYTVAPSKTGFTFTPGSQGATVSNANQTGVNFSSVAVTYAISGTISGVGGNGATVTLSGAGTGTTVASSTGVYTFSGLANGNYTVAPTKTSFSFTPASQNVTVTAANVTGVNFSSGTATYSLSGTITGAGGNAATITLAGAATATATADSSGNFTVPGLVNGTYTVTPSKTGFTFTPVNRSKTIAGANATAVNFSAPGAPAVQLSPASLGFGNQQTGVASVSQPVTLTNSGTAALTISTISFTGTNPTNFAQTNNCGSSLAVGANCTINVTFTPSANGSRTAKLSVADNAVPTPQTVTVSGTGVALPTAQLSVSSMAFGTLLDLTTSAAKSVTLHNSGSTPLLISSISITGANPGDFIISSNACGASLAAAGSCLVKVEFVPQAAGARTASLSFTTNAADSPEGVSLNGTGTLVKFTPVSLAFSAQNVGTASFGKIVTVKNAGPDILTFSAPTITGANSGDFSVTTTCGATLAVNASCNVSVKFAPIATGSRAATLNINDSDPTSPQLVALTGTGQ